MAIRVDGKSDQSKTPGSNSLQSLARNRLLCTVIKISVITNCHSGITLASEFGLPIVIWQADGYAIVRSAAITTQTIVPDQTGEHKSKLGASVGMLWMGFGLIGFQTLLVRKRIGVHQE